VKASKFPRVHVDVVQLDGPPIDLERWADDLVALAAEQAGIRPSVATPADPRSTLALPRP
jgi:hypothetical protein